MQHIYIKNYESLNYAEVDLSHS